MDVPDLNAEAVTGIVASLGALNWGATEVMSANFAVDLLGTGNVGIAYMLFGLAGAISLLEQFDVVDVVGE